VGVAGPLMQAEGCEAWVSTPHSHRCA
jgi:lipid A disaccharide synthetase